MNIPAATGDQIPATDFSNIALNGGLYATDTGSANTYTVTTASPAITALSDGLKITFKAVNANTGASTFAPNALTAHPIVKAGGVALVSGDILANQQITIVYDSSNTRWQMQGSPSARVFAFGGNGSDGALSITSGTTTISLANATYFEKNYSSISITGTGKLAFSNPNTAGTVIVLKSQGNVTLTSSTAPMIDASGMGAAGGTSISAANTVGNVGTSANFIFGSDVSRGGVGATNTSASTGGAVYTSKNIYYLTAAHVYRKWGFWITPGSGGGGGSTGSAGVASGAGGAGGAGLVIECGGAWNFTTALGISVAGAVGGSGTTAGSGATSGPGGGGGGAGGMLIILYNSLTSNSGTINITGGNGGTGGLGGSGGGTNTGGGGGAGAGMFAGAGGGGGKGNSNATGDNGVAGTNSVTTSAGGGSLGAGGATQGGPGGGGGGGGGTAGEYIITANTELA